MRNFFLLLLLLGIGTSRAMCSENIEVVCNRNSVHCVATFDNKSYQVIVGKNGLSENKIQGDCKTPIGEFTLSKTIFYRDDKINKSEFENNDYEFAEIKENLTLCRDFLNIHYNKLVHPNDNHQCKQTSGLYRADSLFNIVIPIDYNVNPVIAGKGAGIFIHTRGMGNSGSKGCIRFWKNDLVKIINKLTDETRIVIDYKNHN